MILSKLVMRSCKQALDAAGSSAGYTAHLYIAPQGTQYPFVTFFPAGVATRYTLGRQIRLEDVRMQFSAFGATAAAVADALASVESALDGYSTEVGEHSVVHAHKLADRGPVYLEREHYWMGSMDLQFVCEARVDSESSSSSSGE